MVKEKKKGYEVGFVTKNEDLRKVGEKKSMARIYCLFDFFNQQRSFKLNNLGKGPKSCILLTFL